MNIIKVFQNLIIKNEIVNWITQWLNVMKKTKMIYHSIAI